MLNNLSLLKNAAGFFEKYYFEPFKWSSKGVIELEGFSRRVTFSKGGLLGEVAKYYVDDYIIWGYDGHSQESAFKNLIKLWQPETDVLNHRFLLLGEKTGAEPQKKAFWFGFRGWLEIFPYKIDDEGHENFKDLIYLANKGMQPENCGGG